MNSKNGEYSTLDYWTMRYELDQDSFEWFKKYSDIKQIFNIIPKHYKLLILGCGTDTLSEELFKDGYKHILNIDFASNLIERMKLTNFNMEWKCMDVTNLEIESESIDCAIDKGTMDALMCEDKQDVWNPSDVVRERVNKEISEVYRVLSKNGIFIYITFGQPHFRTSFFNGFDWELEIKTLGVDFHYFVYILRKNGEVKEDLK